jgi:hypothetical protein
MLSTVLEVLGLSVITAGVTGGVLTLAGVGWALIAFGFIGGACVLFVGVALSVPETSPVKPKVRRALTNDQVESV